MREKAPQARLALRICDMEPGNRVPHLVRLSAMKLKEHSL